MNNLIKYLILVGILTSAVYLIVYFQNGELKSSDINIQSLILFCVCGFPLLFALNKILNENQPKIFNLCLYLPHRYTKWQFEGLDGKYDSKYVKTCKRCGKQKFKIE